ncbi:hypothetical protein E8E13_001291 [Curvularia kusanoi]|uniref:BTB domain-containing protein n=1 Tax=Curvularia kusanoi TaxID=90978 RepID=A0A9P4W591_CURKU|nr:hypothetical protein E8E13_001291 [Curvularia kusanoi]
MNDLTFLDAEFGSELGDSNAILKAVLPGGKVMHIADIISPFKFVDSCPLLYHAFEYNAQGRLQASIEASSETAVISLVRFCYTGNYLASEPDGESVQLLQHAETYKIAEDFDVAELQIIAHGNFSCQIEYACCLPKSPDDFLDTIRFLYQNFASDEARRQHNLVDTLLNYCVAVYLIHKLGEDLDFLTAIHELPAFRQDLCRTNIVRNFEDDCAAQIIRLPDSPMASSSRAPTTLASRELPTEMYYDLPRVPAPAASTAFAASAIFQESTSPLMLSNRRNVLRARTGQREFPDPSKHCASPIALAAALEKYRNSTTSDSEDTETDTTYEESYRKYKRARFEDTAAWLEGRFTLPKAEVEPETSGYKGKARATLAEQDEDLYWASKEPACNSTALARVTATEQEEDLYWAGATSSETATFKPVPVHTDPYRSPTANGAATSATASPFRISERPATTLPYRPRSPSTPPDTGFTTDTASEDESFTMVNSRFAPTTLAPHSPMSSPELVATPSIAEALKKFKEAESEDEWTML